LFAFLTWLFCAVYLSSGDEWWTVMEVKQSSYDTYTGSLSFKRLIGGVLTFILAGLLLYKMMEK
jgi:hypothetical protein